MNQGTDNFLSLYVRAPHARPYVLGHRGARNISAENTISSMQTALSEGADGVEIDIRMSKDGVVLLGHDDEFESSSNKKPLLLSSLTFAQILDVKKQNGEHLATLRDVLDFQKTTDARVNIELKGDVPAPQWMADEVSSQIRKHGGRGLLLSSFSPLIVQKLARSLPTIPTALLFDSSQKVMQRLLPARFLGAKAVHPEEVLLNPELIKRIRKNSPLVNAWTVNDPARACLLAEWGIDAIITDEPRLIREALDSWLDRKKTMRDTGTGLTPRT